MISMVTIGNTNTKVSTSGSRRINVELGPDEPHRLAVHRTCSCQLARGGPPAIGCFVEQAEQGVLEGRDVHAQVVRYRLPAHQRGADVAR